MKNIILLIFVSVVLQTFAQEKKDLLSIGDNAPKFKVAIWLKGEPGNGIERGYVNVIEFWATWCGPCLANIPHLSKIAETYQSKGVKVFGISINERKNVDADSLKRFIAGSKGQNMHYIVGADDSAKYMSENWQVATGHRGIPFAMIVDRNGKIAWMGHPALIDKPLEQVINNSWDLVIAKKNYLENKRLDSIDASKIVELNAYIASKKFTIGLKAIDTLVNKEPNLKYRFYTAHYKFVYLMHINPEEAVMFARKTWAKNDFPDWKGVSDVVYYFRSNNIKMPSSVYKIGIEALQAQIEHYLWSMNIPDTYNDIASFAFMSGDKNMAIEYENKAIDAGKNNPKITAEQLTKFQNNLNNYMNK